MTAEALIRNSTIYSHHANAGEALPHIHTFVRSSGCPVTCVLFSAGPDIHRVLLEPRAQNVSVDEEHRADGVQLVNVSRAYGRKLNKQVKGRILVVRLSTDGLYLAITDEGTPFVEDGLCHLLRKLYPAVILPFFYSRELEQILDALAASIRDGRVMLTKVSSRSRIESDTARKARESDVKWTDKPYGEFFAEVRQNDVWVLRMAFDALLNRQTDTGQTRQVTMLSGCVSQSGLMRCGKDFQTFLTTVIHTASDIFVKRLSKLRNRARTAQTGYLARPLCIEFEEPVFKQKTQVARLMGVLEALPSSSFSLLHGNPYLHLTMTDWADDSNYDVWVLSHSRITICPQTVCSESSLNRLCEHLSREFDEGVIKDLTEVTF